MVSKILKIKNEVSNDAIKLVKNVELKQTDDI